DVAGSEGQHPVAHAEEPVAGDPDEDLQSFVPVGRTRVAGVGERVELDEERELPLHRRIVVPSRIQPVVDDAGLEGQRPRDQDAHTHVPRTIPWTFFRTGPGRILQKYDKIFVAPSS